MRSCSLCRSFRKFDWEGRQGDTVLSRFCPRVCPGFAQVLSRYQILAASAQRPVIRFCSGFVQHHNTLDDEIVYIFQDDFQMLEVV